MIDQWVSVGGARIRYVDTGGPGVPVLFCSGIGGSLELWARQLEALGEELRLVAWDYPGHGLSDAVEKTHDPDSYAAVALGVLEALGLERAVIVGNSLGGTIALRLAGLAPDRVAGMVLVAPAMIGPKVFLPFRLMTLPLLGEIMTRPGEASVARQIAALFHDPRGVSDDLRGVIWRNVHKAGAARALLATLRRTLWLGGVRRSYWRRSRDLLAAARCPILFIHGRQDVVLPFGTSADCARSLPRSRISLIDGCGHTPQIERPEAFNAALATFMRQAGVEQRPAL